MKELSPLYSGDKSFVFDSQVSNALNTSKDVAGEAWESTKEFSGKAAVVTAEGAEHAWEGTKEIGSDMWEGTKNIGSSVAGIFTSSDKEKDNREGLHSSKHDVHHEISKENSHEEVHATKETVHYEAEIHREAT